jgi:hypothetical protein
MLEGIGTHIMRKTTTNPRAKAAGKHPPAKSQAKKTTVRKPKSDAVVVSVASRLPAVTPAQVRAAKKTFDRGVLARGEASPAGEPLKPGATHVIVGSQEDGTPLLKRKRFSLK